MELAARLLCLRSNSMRATNLQTRNFSMDASQSDRIFVALSCNYAIGPCLKAITYFHRQ
jgi:hypothetical protein